MFLPDTPPGLIPYRVSLQFIRVQLEAVELGLREKSNNYSKWVES
jgi:hypothetical protein